MMDMVFRRQPYVKRFDAVNHTNKHIRVKLTNLVKVEGGEKSVPPAKRRVRIDNQVFVRFGFGDDVLKDAAPQGMQALEGNIEDASGRDIRRLGIHSVADIAKQYVFSPPLRQITHLGEVSLFVNANHAGDENDHN
jgi:hypothetical protein